MANPAAPPVILVNGILDCKATWSFAFMQQDPFRDLLLRHSGVRPWNNLDNYINPEEYSAMENLFQAVYWLGNGAVRAKRSNRINPISNQSSFNNYSNGKLIWMIMEILMPPVQNTRYAEGARARNFLGQVLQKLTPLNGVIAHIDQERVNKVFTKMTKMNGWDFVANAPLVSDVWGNDDTTKTFEHLNTIIMILACIKPSNDAHPIRVLSLCLTTLCKRRNPTYGYLQKVSSAVSSDTGVQMEIEREEIRDVWSLISHQVSEEQTESSFKRWLSFLPSSVVKVITIFSHAGGENLMAITTIGNAIRKFAAFPWNEIKKLFPDEYDKILDACDAIKGQPLYGIRRNLGPASFKNFKNVGYVAQQLMIRLGGQEHLSRATCFTKNPHLKQFLDCMIERYINAPPMVDSVPLGSDDQDKIIEAMSTLGFDGDNQ